MSHAVSHFLHGCTGFVAPRRGCCDLLQVEIKSALIGIKPTLRQLLSSSVNWWIALPGRLCEVGGRQQMCGTPQASTWHTVGSQPCQLPSSHLTAEETRPWLPGIINAQSSAAGPNWLWQGQLAPASPTIDPPRTCPVICPVLQSIAETLPNLFPLLNTSVTASWQGQSAKVNICEEYVPQASHLNTEARGAQLILVFPVCSTESSFPGAPLAPPRRPVRNPKSDKSRRSSTYSSPGSRYLLLHPAQ
jgi:hypothetical protein